MGSFLGKKRERNENGEIHSETPSISNSLQNTPMKDNSEIKKEENQNNLNSEVKGEEKEIKVKNPSEEKNKKEKSDNPSEFKLSDKELLALDEEGINNLTVENLKDLIRSRKLKIGSSKKVEMVTRLVSYLKEKFSKSYIQTLITERKFDNWNVDGLKGIMKLYGCHKLPLGKITKKELIQRIEDLIK